jgi:hypothetical protein
VQEDVGRLPEISQTLYDPSEQVQEEATRKFPKLFPIERNPPIQQVIIKEQCSSSSASTCPSFVIFFAAPVALSKAAHLPSFNEAFISKLKPASLSHFVIVDKTSLSLSLSLSPAKTVRRHRGRYHVKTSRKVPSSRALVP